MSTHFTTGMPYNTITVIEQATTNTIICMDCLQVLTECMSIKRCGRCPACKMMSGSTCSKCNSHVCPNCECQVCNGAACYCHFQCKPNALKRSDAVGNLRIIIEEEKTSNDTSDNLANAMQDMKITNNHMLEDNSSDYYQEQFNQNAAWQHRYL